MKIELELDDKEVETFLIVKTQDINVTKYSSEAKRKQLKMRFITVYMKC